MIIPLLSIGLLAAPAVVRPDVQVISPTHLLITQSGAESLSGDWSDWSILSPDDPEFMVVVNPTDAIAQRRPTDMRIEEGEVNITVDSRVILELPAPLTAGSTYQIGAARNGLEWEYVHEPSLNWTPSIRINELGYRGEANDRWGYVSHWFGRLAAMDLNDEHKRFSVVDSENGRIVLEGRMSLRAPYDQATDDVYGANYSQATVYELNLFEAVGPGTMHVVWEGVGRSHDFRVTDDVYDDAFLSVFRALMHLRVGQALDDTLTPFGTQLCPDRPAVLSTYVPMGAEPGEGAIQANATEDTAEVVGGYQSAADCDRRIEDLAVLDALVDLYELDPLRFSRDDLGIPESGNGIPDVLDEARWGIDVFLKLQGRNGSIRRGVVTYPVGAKWEDGPVDFSRTEWFIYGEDPMAAYRFAAAAAKLARALRDWDEEGAREYLDGALRAWSWAESNRPEEEDSYWDALAAVELLKTTGQGEYDRAFIDHMPFEEDDLVFSFPRFASDDVMAPLIAYVSHERTSAEHREAAQTILQDRYRYLLMMADGLAFRFVKHPYDPVENGNLTSAQYARMFFRLFEHFGDLQLEEWGSYVCDGILGANASGRSWVTGLGSRSVQNPLHRASLEDDIPVALPGLIVQGPCASEACQMADGVLGSALDVFEPPVSDWPLAELYADLAYVPQWNSVSTAQHLAPALYAFGYLALLDGGDRLAEMGGAGDMGTGTGGAGGGEAGTGGEEMMGEGGTSSNTGGMSGGMGGDAADQSGGEPGMGGSAGDESDVDGGMTASSAADSGCDCDTTTSNNTSALWALLMAFLWGMRRRSWRRA